MVELSRVNAAVFTMKLNLPSSSAVVPKLSHLKRPCSTYLDTPVSLTFPQEA